MRLLDGSGMSGDVHVPFCEGLGVRFPGSTLRNVYVGSRRSGDRLMASMTRRVIWRQKPSGCSVVISNALEDCTNIISLKTANRF